MKRAIAYDISGKQKGKVNLDSRVFEQKENPKLLKQAVDRYLANLREPIAKTKTRGERRGGGRKPFRQKGTGRARAGTKRSPIWRKGGVVFGPRGVENYSKKMPRKAIKLAILSALSQKAQKERILVLENFKLEKPQTKKIRSLIEKLPVERRILFINGKDPIFVKSTSNLSLTTTSSYNQLNAYDILVADYLIIFKDILDKIAEIYAGKEVEKVVEKVEKEALSKAKTPKKEAKKVNKSTKPKSSKPKKGNSK